jgi:hypothetical protein
MTSWMLVGIAALAAGGWTAYRRTRQVPCTLDLESTPHEFHAHVVLEGLEVHEGDEVLVHGAPSAIAIGEVRTLRSTATVQQASWPRRVLVRVLGTSGITELYEVGFEG